MLALKEKNYACNLGELESLRTAFDLIPDDEQKLIIVEYDELGNVIRQTDPLGRKMNLSMMILAEW